MTPEGYKILCEALAAVPGTQKFTVRPQPRAGEDVPKVEITVPGTRSEPIFRALGGAGLRHNSDPPHTDPNAPSLAFFSSVIPWATRDKITLGFRDKKVENNHD
jgi:hypothetical protein